MKKDRYILIDQGEQSKPAEKPERYKIIDEGIAPTIDRVKRRPNIPRTHKQLPNASFGASNQEIWKMSPLEAGFDQGLAGTGQGLMQLGLRALNKLPGDLVTDEQIDAYDAQVNRDIVNYEAYKNQNGGVGNFVGEMGAGLATAGIPIAGPLSRLAGASKILKNMPNVVKYGAAGALGAGSQRTADENFVMGKLGQAGTGAVLGPALSYLGQLGTGILSKGVGSLINRRKSLDELLSPEEMARLRDFRQADIEPTTGQITRDFQDQSTEARAINLEKDLAGDVGPKIRRRFDDQGRALDEKTASLETQFGGNTEKSALQAGKTVQSAAKSRAKTSQGEVAALYDVARNNPKWTQPVLAQKQAQFHNDFSEILNDFEDSIPVDIKRRVQEIADGVRQFTPEENEKLSRLINMHYDPIKSEKATIAALDKTRDALKNTIGDFPELLNARAASSRRFNEVQKTHVAKILDKEMGQEETAKKMLVNGSIEDLRGFKAFLMQGNADDVKRGQQAIKELKSSIMRMARSRALRQVSDVDNELVDETARTLEKEIHFNGGAFKRFLENQVGEDKLKLLFSPDELREINVIKRIGEYRIPKPGTTNPSGTSQAIFNFLGKWGGPIRSYVENRARGKTFKRALDPESAMRKRETDFLLEKISEFYDRKLGTGTSAMMGVKTEQERRKR